MAQFVKQSVGRLDARLGHSTLGRISDEGMVGVNIETLWAWLGDKRRGTRRVLGRIPPRTIEPPDLPPDELLHPGVEGEEGKEDHREEGITEALKLRMKESDEDKEGMKEEEEEEARRKEIETLLARVTHLHLESRGITHIVQLQKISRTYYLVGPTSTSSLNQVWMSIREFCSKILTILGLRNCHRIYQQRRIVRPEYL
ncbi:uncharacterized protein LOC119582939 [Penaeus monodon]|uniref:uncharacterized protein LOC119582939 n=1 Tax=Penaeus monodon TaxID=6687 RepID=UPI0018A7C27C|nr:uncharacterized protein LOC119582939 [Penaeus monodon]